MSHPELRKSTDLEDNDIGTLEFECNTTCVELSNDNTKCTWKDPYSASWIQVPTKAHLHNGNFSFDFDIESYTGQIGIGFLLDWEGLGPDWGFFGYLGASGSAFSYDPSTGDIVSNTESIQGGLPRLDGSGVVSLELMLPRDGTNTATFIVNGERTPSIRLPAGSVVVPAACLLRRGQIVTLRNFQRL